MGSYPWYFACRLYRFIKLGLAKELCKLMNGSYYAMDTISADRILRVSRR